MSQPPRRAPLPAGPLTGPRTKLRRAVAYALAGVNRLLDALPPLHRLHRRVRAGLEFTALDLPVPATAAGLDGLRLAFVSDVHAGSFLDGADLDELFGRIAATAPDLVLFGGDLINSRESELALFAGPLRRLAPPLGMFAVPGNHDHFWGPDLSAWSEFLAAHGVTVLCNRGVRICRGGASLWLCGVDDLTEGRPDLPAALAGRRVGEPALLLSHHPDFFFEAAAVDVDLTLAGHTHGGQIRIGGRAPIHHSRFGYERGWFVENGCRLYVGRGVGVTVLPLRRDAAPEVPLVTLRAVPAVGDAGRGAGAEAGAGSCRAPVTMPE
jgi:predicted MPP superfamily phosphohydrolase